MMSWCKDEEEASRQRVAKRDNAPSNNINAATINGGRGRKTTTLVK